MQTDEIRRNMVEQQIRTWEVLDENVLTLYEDPLLRRENFIEKETPATLAYADMMLPIGCGQVMLEPKLEARMMQHLAPKHDEKILHVGTGSGFFAAMLGRLAGEVVSAEIHAPLADAAAARLKKINADNVRVLTADAAYGVAEHAPYDAVVLTASTPRLPDELIAQLKVGGRLIAVVGEAPAMTLRLLEKHGENNVFHRDILETVIPTLINAPSATKFTF